MIKRLGINGLLILGSLLFSCLTAEVIVERLLITLVPLKLHFALSDGIGLLAQSSKHNRLPQDYIALLGDSYAQGKGDWLLEADPNRNSPFHSAHLIQQRTGRDVVNFGRSGVGNVRGFVVEPVARWRFVHDNIDAKLQPPTEIWAYFYAGNDLEDNLADLRREFFPQHAAADVEDDLALQAFIRKAQAQRRGVGPFPAFDINTGWLLKSAYRVMHNALAPEIDGEIIARGVNKPGLINRALVGGAVMPLPDALQSPALSLDQTQFHQGMRVFAAALHALRERFPHSRVSVVYLPSVLESYPIVSGQVSFEDKFRHSDAQADTETLLQRSNELCHSVRGATLKVGATFIDTRATIRNAASHQLIHGPRDWKHFNKAGYHALVRAILDSPTQTCDF